MPPVVYAWVSKVYLCFDAEDPNKHGLRIKDAVKRRIDMENIMRYNLYIDCLPMLDFPEVSGDVMVNIVERTGSLNLKTTEHALAKVLCFCMHLHYDFSASKRLKRLKF